MKITKLFFLLTFFVSSFFLSQVRKQPLEIKLKTDFTHSFTKTIFPETLLGYKRKYLVSYDEKNYNIGSSYELKVGKKLSVISVYIYPAEVSNENLREQYGAFTVAIDRKSQNKPVLKPEMVQLQSDNAIVNGIMTVFPYQTLEPDFFKGVKTQNNQSLLSVYDAGKWNIKFRVTSEFEDTDRLRALEKSLVEYFKPMAIAESFSLKNSGSPNIVISQTAQRDSLMLKSTIVEAEAKKNWLGENKKDKELMMGLSDFEIDSHVFSLTEKLKFYQENKDKLKETELTKKYFDNLQLIVDNGFLKDYIYKKNFGVVIYQEGESRRVLYNEFLLKHEIPEEVDEMLYKIYF